MKKAFIIFCCILCTRFLFAEDSSAKIGFSSEEARLFANSSPFIIQSGYFEAKNTIIGGAKGRYELESYQVAKADSYQYVIELVFRKKAGWVSYSHHATLYVMDDGQKLWIKSNGRTAQYIWSRPASVISSSNGQTVVSDRQSTIDVDIDGMRLILQK